MAKKEKDIVLTADEIKGLLLTSKGNANDAEKLFSYILIHCTRMLKNKKYPISTETMDDAIQYACTTLWEYIVNDRINTNYKPKQLCNYINSLLICRAVDEIRKQGTSAKNAQRVYDGLCEEYSVEDTDEIENLITKSMTPISDL